MSCLRAIAIWLLVAVGLAALPAPLRAEAAAGFDLRYTMYWGGFKVGRLDMAYAPGPEGYRSDLSLQAVGIAGLITDFRGEARIEGARSVAAELTPLTYDSLYERRDHQRTTLVGFDPDTGDVTRLRLEKRGQPRQSKVPAAMRKDVVDPLTAILRLRDQIGALRAGGEPFTAAIFDGNRRYDLRARYVGRTTVETAGRRWPALELQVELMPRAGFHRNDIAETEAADGLPVELLVSDDARRIPLRLTTRGAGATAVLRLTRDCSDGCPVVSN